MLEKTEVPRMTVLEAVLEERERQDKLWGDQIYHSDAWWNVIASEENGEVAREVYEQDEGKLYAEIIQACAVYFAWAEAIYRRRKLDEMPASVYRERELDESNG